MTQQTSPFIEGKWGWTYGESGWNLGMDENLLKFSFLFDKNITAIVSSLPAAVNGNAYFLTTDNRIYYAVGSIFYSTPVPKWFVVTIKTTGETFQFDGSTMTQVPDSTDIVGIQATIASLGTAAFQPSGAFATPASVTSAITTANIYTDSSITTFNEGLQEKVEDFVGAAVVGVQGVQTSYNDTTGFTSVSNVSFTYATAAISVGTLTFNPSAVGVYGVTLNADVTSLSITAPPVGVHTKLSIIFIQDSTGNRKVQFPASVKFPIGVSKLVACLPGDTTLLRLSTADGGVTWYAEAPQVFVTQTVKPTLTGENSTFNDEALATTGWVQTNATLTQSGSSLIHTKTAGAISSSSVKSATLPTANRDFILYGKARAKNAANNCAVIWLTDGTKEFGLWFGSPDAGTTLTTGTMSISGYTSSTQKVSLGSGYDYENVYVDFALHCDTTFGTMTCYFRGTDGLWNFKGRILHTWFTVPEIKIQTPSAAIAGTWLEFDFLTIARPNMIAIGDSICAGSTGFNPNNSLGLTNYSSSWHRYANPYPTLRNNLIVNKGIGGQTSTQILARIVTDVTNHSPQLVYLHASTNDEMNAISQTTRTSNIQSTVSALAPAQVVLLNAMWGCAGSVDNSYPRLLRDYTQISWPLLLTGVTGTAQKIDIARPLASADGYQNYLLTVTDGLHPNPPGYAAIGQTISQ